MYVYIYIYILPRGVTIMSSAPFLFAMTGVLTMLHGIHLRVLPSFQLPTFQTIANKPLFVQLHSLNNFYVLFVSSEILKRGFSK